MNKIVSYVRSNSNNGLDGLKGAFDDATILNVKKLIDNWNARFGDGSYQKYRHRLQEVARSQSDLPRVDDWRSVEAEWIAPVDDDDWHLEGVTPALDIAADKFDCVLWSVVIYDLTESCFMARHQPDFMRGAHTSGYAVRKSFLEQLTEEQQNLILHDHFNAHRYVHFAGKKYLVTAFCGGVHVITPASITAAIGHNGELSFATIEKYEELLQRTVFGVDMIVRETMNLIDAL